MKVTLSEFVFFYAENMRKNAENRSKILSWKKMCKDWSAGQDLASYGWVHTISWLVCRRSGPRTRISRFTLTSFHPCCSKYQYFIPCYAWIIILLYQYATFHSSIHHLMDIWMVSIFWLLWIMLLRTVMYKLFMWNLFLNLLGIYPGVEFVSQMVTLC